MKEILKCRVWDGKKKKMYYLDNWASIFGYEESKDLAVVRFLLPRNFGEPKKFVGINMQNVELMLDTGLNDKHGEDVYAGDIVEHQYAFGGGKGVVVYSAPRFCLQLAGEVCDEIDFSTCAIVGNIYEDPELIN